MGRKSRRWLIALLSVIMAALFVPAMVYAAYDESDLWYDYDDGPETIMTGNWGFIDGTIAFENQATEEDKLLKVTGVKSSDTSICRVSKDGSDWEYQGLKEGTATLTVSFTDYNNKTNSYKKVITVQDEIIELNLELERTKVLPGGTVKVRAEAVHLVYDETEGPQEAISYQWALVGGSDQYADITPDTEDPSQATISVDADALTPDEEEDYVDDQYLQISVTASAPRVKGSGTVSAVLDDEEISVVDHYYELLPRENKIDLYQPNATVTFKPQLILYTMEKPDGTELEGTKFDLNYENDEEDQSIRIEKGDDGAYTLTRTGNDSATLTMTAEYTSPDGESDYEDEETYYFDQISTNLEDFQIQYTNLPDKDSFFVDEGVGIAMPRFEVEYAGRVLPEDKYTAVIYPVFNQHSDEESYGEPVDMNAESLNYLPPKEGEENFGQTVYRIVVEAKADTGYEGSCKREIWLHSNSNLFNSDITLPAKFFLSKYNSYRLTVGQTATPTVTMDGKTLTAGTDYALEYVNDRTGISQKAFPKKVGNYTCIAEGIDPYYAAVGADIQIVPKKTAITKVKAGKKSFTVKWKKQASQTTGYQIQYSLKKNFSSKNKMVKIKKNKTTSSTIKKLKKKKIYYVRVRTYTKSGSDMFYSDWSTVKKVKTK